MKHTPILAAALVVALSGCATTGVLPGKQTSGTKPAVSSQDKSEARRSAFKSGAKGCAIGAGMSVIGAIFGGGINAKAAIASCVVAGTATGIQEYRSQLDQFRALKTKVTVGAVVTVKEKDVQIAGETAKAAESLTLALDAKKVAASHADIGRVLTELSAVLNKQTMPITVTVSGSRVDRTWISAQLHTLVKNKMVTITDTDGPSPVIVVSPVPVIK